MTGSGYGPPPEYEQQPTQQYGPAPYGQPQYGQTPPEYAPGYGQPGQRHAPNPYGRSPVTYEFGVVGTVTAAVGAIFAVISFTAVDWFKNGVGFSDVGDLMDQSNSPPQPAGAYFGWLGLVLVGGGVGGCVAGCTPSPAAQALRAIGAILAAISIAITFFAIRFQD